MNKKEPKNLQKNLSRSYGRFLKHRDVWKGHQKHRYSVEELQNMQKNLSAMFGSDSAMPLKKIRMRLGLAHRGYKLIHHALSVSIPKQNSVPNIRKLQWNFLMVFSGLEMLIQALVDNKNISIENHFSLITENLSFSKSLLMFDRERKLVKRWDKDSQHFKYFLYCRKNTWKSFKDFFDSKEDIDDVVDMLKITHTFRNLTAHGMLSPTKIKDLGQKQNLEVMRELIIVVAANILTMLGDRYNASLSS